MQIDEKIRNVAKTQEKHEKWQKNAAGKFGKMT